MFEGLVETIAKVPKHVSVLKKRFLLFLHFLENLRNFKEKSYTPLTVENLSIKYVKNVS